MTVLLLAADRVGSVAFLKSLSPFWITMICLIPALLFTIYVFWDDARQARAHRREAAKGGTSAH